MGSTNPTARTVDAIVATIPIARSVFVKLLTGRENVKVSIPSELSELDACPLNTQYLSANVGEGEKIIGERSFLLPFTVTIPVTGRELSIAVASRDVEHVFGSSLEGVLYVSVYFPW